MFRYLVWLCLIGFTVHIIKADDVDYDSYEEENNYEEIPVLDDVPDSEKDFDSIIKDISKEDKNIDKQEEDIQYDDIKDYQIEDNRSEGEIQPENKNDEFKGFVMLKGDDDLAPPDDIDEKRIKSQELTDKDFEDVINTYLSRNLQSENEILEETKSILNEDVENDFKDIGSPVLNESNVTQIVEETNKILNDTDNRLDENNETNKMNQTVSNSSENDQDEINKQFKELLNSLDELHATRNKLIGDLDTLVDDGGFNYDDDYTKSKEQDNDYEAIDDKSLWKLFSEKSEENSIEDAEKIREDSLETAEKTVPLFNLNSDVSAVSDATTLPKIDIKSNDNKNRESTEIPNISKKSTIEPLSVTHNSYETSTSFTKPDVDIINEPSTDILLPKYFEERNTDAIATNTIHITLNVNEPTVVTSPNYPNNYNTGEITDYIITGDGMGIEMNVTDFSVNGFIGDYLLVSPGRTDNKGSDGILFSYGLKEERKLRFTDVDRMFMRFEANPGMAFQKGFSMSMKMIAPRIDVVDEDIELDPPVFDRSNATLSVNIGGITLHPFVTIEKEFTRILADMATMYINLKEINPGVNDTTNITQIVGRALCFRNWPGSENCVEVTFSIPLDYDEEVAEPRLTQQDLRDMWDTYALIDPFAARLRLLGVEEFTYPDDRAVVTVWLVIAGGVVISMAMLAFALWRFSCFEEYTKMPSYSDTDSINEKRHLDLYPTPHQTLPSLYSETDFKWPDSKYDALDGFTNKNYMREDIYDVESDDEFRKTERRYTTDV